MGQFISDIGENEQGTITCRWSDGVIRNLQQVLHAAARLVTGVRWNEHVTPALCDVVKQQITCKIGTMAFSCVRSTCSAYFSVVCMPFQTVGGRA